ncbi:hypothetical protein AV926_11470 [Myroides marinus]|uniref:DUF4249 domain-containing protein n=1 Tax=Myroides marinus TaxID=703342 RepID=A0A161UQA3_9FLAO|nr:DUF4249 domain-containing protein [Myroides marinus]KUF44048.1 hypothetical protein AS361_06180 [Myroides marinus]KZE79791.1 hypothetical protein AV926_11470 [Myroides marinus]
MINKTLKYIGILSLAMYFTSCEEVIDLELPTAPPKLVVEGNIDFNTDNTPDTLSVKLSLTTDFYNPTTPKVHNAIVWIEDGEGNRYPFEEIKNTGRYINTKVKKDFVKNQYKLHIEYDNDIYEATDVLLSTPEIQQVEQRREKFFNKDYYTIRIYYKDTPRPSSNLNYYYSFSQRNNEKPELKIQTNEYSKNKIIESIFLDEDFEVGDKVLIDLHQISRNYYDYMSLLISTINNGGGPFETPITKIKGNVKNLTRPEKEALGYFRITEKQTVIHTIYEQPKP